MSEKRIQRSGLGRGLSALMADVAQASQGVDAAQRTNLAVAVEALVPNPNQPRRNFDQDGLAELADSIRQKGIVQPLIVRPIAETGKYEIVAGERRWRAAQLAGLHQVPVLIRDYSDEEVLEVAIIENIQRADLNSLEEALAYRQLMDRFGHTQDRLAASLSRSRSHVANTLRLLLLPNSVQELLRDGSLTAGHARALITSQNPEELAVQVVKRGLSVRETERLARPADTGPAVNKPRGNRRGKKDADTAAIEADLSANLGMEVVIDHGVTGEGGLLSVRYMTLDDLDRLCEVLSKASPAQRG